LKYKNILFDLDGTLIDSAPGIELSFRYAYKIIYKKDCPISLIPLIGPPIDQVLTNVNGEINLKTKSQFLDVFKEHYDQFGYKNTLLYNGVKEVLGQLAKKKMCVFIATNKRIKPTKLILEYFAINKFFNKVYCPDSEEVKFQNKTELISYIIKSKSLKLIDTLMVGDTIHDGIAANKNKIDFTLVEYGYGQYENCKYKLQNINQLINIL
jgi:phosphoglycolate phosphatase